MKFSNTLLAGTVALTAGLVNAALSLASCSFSTTITAADGIQSLNACPTLDGSITVKGDGVGSIELNAVKEIKGDLKFFNSSTATSINLNQLKKISGSLAITAYTQLFTIDFTSLDEVNLLSLVSLPSFSTININTGIANVSSLELSDTALDSLTGLTTLFSTVDFLNINNNKNITEIDLSNLKSIGQNLILSFNADNCTIDLSNLSGASNLTIQDAGDINVSNLTYVNGTFNVAYNAFDQVAFPSLSTVGGAFQFYANDVVTNASFPELTNIGGELRIFNNTVLEDFDLDKLKKIKGAVNVSGDFANFTMGDLEEVDGDFSLVSTNDDFDCSDLNSLHSSSKIEGHNYTCSAPQKSSSTASSSSKGSKSTDAASSTSSGSSSSSSSSSSSKKSGATSNTATYFMGVTALAFSIVAVVL